MLSPLLDWISGRVASDEQPTLRDAIGTLRQIPIFQDYTRAHLRDFAHGLHFRDYRADDYVYYEEDPGLGLYIVQRGAVRLLVEDEQGLTQEVKRVRENDFFGTHALFGEVRRTETAQVIGDTRLLGFFRPDLNALINRHPKSGAAIMLAFAQHIVAHDLETLQLLCARAGRPTAHQALHQALSANDAATPTLSY